MAAASMILMKLLWPRQRVKLLRRCGFLTGAEVSVETFSVDASMSESRMQIFGHATMEWLSNCVGCKYSSITEPSAKGDGTTAANPRTASRGRFEENRTLSNRLAFKK